MKRKDYLTPALQVNGLLTASILAASDQVHYIPNPGQIGGGTGDNGGTTTGPSLAKDVVPVFQFD